MASCLILTGFMGSGKSVVGRKAAQDLGWDFADSDRLAETEMGMTISEAFASRGEEYFRQIEEKVVAGLLDQVVASADIVLSLGGGAVTIPNLFQRLLQQPLVVFLDQDYDVSLSRAQNGRRPLAADPVKFRELFDARQDVYRELARFSVDARGKSVKRVAADVVRIARERTQDT
ncbi:MAG: shikimate kinase [Thermoleophilia bacterium]